MIRTKTNFLFILFALLLVSCRQINEDHELTGDKVSFVFDADSFALLSYRINGKQGSSHTISAHKGTETDYFVLLDEQKISFNPHQVKENNGLQFSYVDSLFEASITWKMIYEDAALVELAVIPKKKYSRVSVGMNALQIEPTTIKDIYCVPHSLPYFRSKEANKLPAGWIDNAGTRNNTFSLITEVATFSLSVLPPDYRLDNELTLDARKDYSISFDGAETDAVVPENTFLELQDCSGSVRVVSNHPYEVDSGEVIVKRFLVHVSENTNEYLTGKHIGQYMATVPFEKEVNANELYLKSLDFLINNKGCFNQSKLHGDNYWGSVHSGTGTAFGNGTAYYAMYGNSFSVTALNQFKALNLLNKEGETRLQAVTDFLTKSPVQNADGSYWSMLLLLNDKAKYSDQAYSERVWTHATAWVTYYLLEAYQLSGEENLLETAKMALRWLVNQQAEDGSFPKYYEGGTACEEKQGDAGWNALAFFKAAELKLSIDQDLDAKVFLEKGYKTVDWIIENQLPQKQYYGSFEDVGGVVDCYASTVCARASIKAYELSKEPKYLAAGKSMLTTSLAWVSCDYNTLNFDAGEHSWDKNNHWQPAYAHIESTSCYYPCSYTLPLLYLAATEYAGFVSGKEQLYWIKIAQNMSHLNSFFNQNPKSKSNNGMEWRMFPFLVFTEWGNAQTCYSIIESLKNRLSLSLPEIQFMPDLTAQIDGNTYKIVMAHNNEPICSANAEVDCLTLMSTDKHNILLALLSEGKKINDTLKLNKALLSSLYKETDEIKVTNHQTNQEIGLYTPQQLSEGIELDFENLVLLELSGNK